MCLLEISCLVTCDWILVRRKIVALLRIWIPGKELEELIFALLQKNHERVMPVKMCFPYPVIG